MRVDLLVIDPFSKMKGSANFQRVMGTYSHLTVGRGGPFPVAPSQPPQRTWELWPGGSWPVGGFFFLPAAFGKEEKYHWPLNNMGVRGTPLLPTKLKNPCVTFDSPKTLLLIASCWLEAFLITGD